MRIYMNIQKIWRRNKINVQQNTLAVLLKPSIMRSALWIGFLVFCNLSQSEVKELQGKREREQRNS